MHVFVYGTLVDPLRLDDVLGHRHRGERLRARLDAYQRVLAPGFEFPFIIPARGAAVDGILVMDLSPADVDALDAYEDLRQGTYERKAVEVDVWGCGPRPMGVMAQTYVGGAALRRLNDEVAAQPTPSTAY